MKKLNSDDRKKLEIVRAVLHNNRHFNTGERVPDLVERRLTEAQTSIRSAKERLAPDEYPDKNGLKNEYATVAAVGHISITRQQGENKHVSAAQFDKLVETFKSLPSFTKNMGDSTDKTIFEHATERNGKMLYDDIGRAYQTMKAQTNIRNNSTRTMLEKTDTLDKTKQYS